MSRQALRIDQHGVFCFAFVCDSCGKAAIAVKYAADRAVSWSPESGWHDEPLVEGTRPFGGWMAIVFGASQSDPLGRSDVWLCSCQCARDWGEAEYVRQTQAS